MKVKNIYIIITAILLTNIYSCNNRVKNINTPIELDDDYNEDDYYRVQGIIIKEKVHFTYSKKFERDIHYIYRLDLDKPLEAVERKSELVLHPEEPVVIMVHKKDSTISFFAHRGIINEELLVEYLTKPDSDYEEWLKND